MYKYLPVSAASKMSLALLYRHVIDSRGMQQWRIGA